MPDLDLFTEAEIQALIALIELTQPEETPNNNFYTFYPETLDQAARYFRKFRLDWTDAFQSLIARRLLTHRGNLYQLTEAGITQSRLLRKARPPIYYWYEEFYAEAPHSPAFTRYSDLAYGKALCQDGFSDMGQLDLLLQVTQPAKHHRILDLGCGVGMIAEYLADQTGAFVTGIDYSQQAIAAAQTRTEARRDRLTFCTGNLDQLPVPAEPFDLIIAIDSLYMPGDLDSTLRQMRGMLAPRGKLAMFYSQLLFDPAEPRELLKADRTPLGQALHRSGLGYQTWDVSAETYAFLQRKRQAAEALREAFTAENRLFLYDHLIAESESSRAPFDPATTNMSRYLYLVEV